VPESREILDAGDFGSVGHVAGVAADVASLGDFSDNFGPPSFGNDSNIDYNLP
jgi:hypothetical protein